MEITHRKWRAAALPVIAVLLAIVLLAQDSNASTLAGPLGNDLHGGFIGEGFSELDPGSEVSATLYGSFKWPHPETVTVTAARLVPVPGTSVPTLRHIALLTGRGSGESHGWPVDDPDFQLHSLIGVPFRAGESVELQVGYQVHGRGYYALAGIELDYTIEGRPYRSTMYGALTGCVHVRCDLDTDDAVSDVIEQMAGFR